MAEDEIVELLAAFLPETLEGWAAVAVLACAVAAVALPRPPENCHPAIRLGHRLICIVGMGAGRLRSAGRIGRMDGIFRRKK